MDCTMMSCCERDAAQQKESARVTAQLRHHDRTRIALQKRRAFSTQVAATPCSTCDSAGPCEHRSLAEQQPAPRRRDAGSSDEDDSSTDDDSDDLDADDPALLRMHEEAMRQMILEKEAKEAAPGMFAVEEEALEQEMAAHRSLVILYDGEDHEATAHLQEHLHRLGRAHAQTRFVCVRPPTYGVSVGTESFSRLRSFLGLSRVPGIVCVRNGQPVTSECGLARQFGDLSQSGTRLEGWLHKARMLETGRSATREAERGCGGGSSDSDDDSSIFQCSKKGCGVTFQHDHINKTFFNDQDKMDSFLEGV